MPADSPSDSASQVEIAGLRELLTQAGVDAARLLKQAGIDATENEAARRLQRLLLEELHHRVKNTIAMVTAISSQSLRSAATLEEGRTSVENRLSALGRAHDLLLQASAARAKAIVVIGAAIEPYEDRQSPRFDVFDTSLDIDATAVLPLTMLLNELCTNAVKYGALSVPQGRVAIALAADETTRRFSLKWSETRGPEVREPTRRGFGSRLIDRLADQLHGETRLNYQTDGLVYEITMPLAGPPEQS